MKIGYKGFDSDLTSGIVRATKQQFVIGETYTKPSKENPMVCSSDGFHYCNDLNTVFTHYPLEKGNRYCEVEILGDFTDSSDKSITTSLKIIRELGKEEIYKHIYHENLNIQVLKDIQTKYPYFHVGGSVGLFLHGVRLSRWLKSTRSDIDLIAPFFILPEGKIGDEDVEYINGKPSANDFDESFIVGGTKVDYRVDPKQRYEVIDYDGFKYKVSPLMTILEAKMKYALLPNGEKHKKDFFEMVLNKDINGKKINLISLRNDLPF